MRRSALLFCAALSLTVLAAPSLAAQHDDHAAHGAAASPAGAGVPRVAADSTFPAGAADAAARLSASPRHGEWVMIPGGAPGDSVRAWIVYPERSTKAPVVVVIHEIFGVSTWIRAVTDQLAADGFIAIAPDLLSGKQLPGDPSALEPDSATVAATVAAIRTLNPADVQRRIEAVGRYGMALPAATAHYGVVGFCWGGSMSFWHAVSSPSLGAAVVYYGGSPEPARLASVRAPVLGLYGSDDARVNATVPPADSAMKALGRTFEPHTFDGAGHGFLRQQDGRGGANLAATRQAWPLTVGWFRKHLGG
ncbi:MAG TPA: dienelactone hydrolase family protein [Gemmatimonadaceae bacterium]|jgi:carboxymethylenebutenolidase|nr:dienelactone hydrolase family protein [Gemmatimonadaceae bacterium]